ncbi:MAG: FSR family fosmidomycin resistance protein-like MFS transporter [Cellvibrionaceae bacterium]|jgi:FSR family fosmidomycin resistance protein-like MFS transporter
MVIDRLKTQLPVLPLTVASSHFSLEVLSNTLPLIYTLLIAQRGFTYSQIGTIALIGGLCGSVTQLLFGMLVDRWDARKQVILSIVWMGVGMGTVGFISSYGWLIVVVGFAKLASAAYHPAGAALANFASNKMKGTSVSYFSVGGSLGSAMSPLIFGLALGAWGLRGTFLLIPCGILLGCLLWSPLGKIPLVSNESQGNVKANKAGSIWALLPIVILVSTRSWTSGTLSTYLPEFYSSQGASLALAGGAFSLVLTTTAVGNLLGGRVADHVGHDRVVIGGMILLSLSFWGFMNLSGPFQVISLALIGVATGMTTPSSLVMAQAAWPQAIGLASSLVMGVAWMPSSLGSWTIGMMADRTSLGFALSTLTYVPLLGVVVLSGSLLYNRMTQGANDEFSTK